MFRPIIRPRGQTSGKFDCKLSKIFKTKEAATTFAEKVILDDWEDTFSNYVKHPSGFDILLEELEVGD